MRRLALAALIAAAACGGDPDYEPPPPHERSLVILGIDGMDPVLIERYKDRLPNLWALAARGDMARLATSDPPQSPVAWSTFITGGHGDSHGIYDFVHRDPDKMEPYLSTSRTYGPSRSIDIGSLSLPVGSSGVELLREGEAFWQRLETAGVPARVVQIPANFPPAPTRTNPSMSGMGTPDLLGTYGTFQVITDLPELRDGQVAGGIVAALDFAGGDRASARLTGPPNPLSASAEAMTAAVDVVRDPEAAAAMIRIGDVEVILEEDEWSGWIPVSFDPGLLGGPVGGIVRLYLADLRPHLRLYVSPINLDPLDPAMPISSPPGYAAAIAADIGRYYTQGMPLDTKALAAGVLSDDELLEQAALVLGENERMLERELDHYEGGLLFFYVSSIDLISHVFWRALEPDASEADAAYAHVIPDLYERVDRMIGRVAGRISDETALVVMSDHGFASYRYKVHLNTWLAQQGYLVLASEPGQGSLGHIDWEKTQAYALGLNQLFINQIGRERTGVVDASTAAVLRKEIARKLGLLRDPDSRQRVVTDVIDVAAEGRVDGFGDRAPDLIVGFNRGYRSSDESALGAVGDVVIERNREKWSGDHCMDARLVPGILVTSFALPDGARPTLADLAPTVLDYFAVDADPAIAGQSLLSKEETR